MVDRKRKDKTESKKLESLQQEITEFKTHQERENTAVRKRLDRLEKSTQVVLENSNRIEALYQEADRTREFRNLSKESGQAVLREIGELTGLPVPLPQTGPETWHASSDANSRIPIDAVVRVFELAPSLLQAIRFISPNRTRNLRDATTGEWKRSAGHFVLRLEFTEHSLIVQRCIQGALLSLISSAAKAEKEEGQACFSMYMNRTVEEMERKRKRQDSNPQDLQSVGRGKGRGRNNGGKGRCRKGSGADLSASPPSVSPFELCRTVIEPGLPRIVQLKVCRAREVLAWYTPGRLCRCLTSLGLGRRTF